VSGREAEAVDSAPAGSLQDARDLAEREDDLTPLKLLQQQDPFQGPKLGSCLTLGNESSKETHVLTKQEILLGKGT